MLKPIAQPGTVRQIEYQLIQHIASQIAKAHDGVLTVTSTAEETKFTFVMPLRQHGES
jgi:nitrogen-specific signal transduction histidine kinase